MPMVIQVNAKAVSSLTRLNPILSPNEKDGALCVGSLNIVFLTKNIKTANQLAFLAAFDVTAFSRIAAHFAIHLFLFFSFPLSDGSDDVSRVRQLFNRQSSKFSTASHVECDSPKRHLQSVSCGRRQRSTEMLFDRMPKVCQCQQTITDDGHLSDQSSIDG